jgi:hypothetical protein
MFALVLIMLLLKEKISKKVYYFLVTLGGKV